MAGLIEVLNNVVGGNLPGAIALAFVIYIATQIVLAIFKHRAERRGYRYERSSATGKMRFEKEAFHIERLSAALLSLVVETEKLEGSDGWLSWKDKERWIDLHEECVERLGAAAPFINFLSSEDGAPSCGVRFERPLAGCALEGSKADDGTNGEQVERLYRHLSAKRSKSLYMRAALLVDACGAVARKRGVGAVGTVLPAEFSGEQKNPRRRELQEKERNLAARYERFADCASCRMRDCEKGSRDARWQRLKDRLAVLWKWPLAGIYHHFDARCPYEMNSCVSDEASGQFIHCGPTVKEKRRTTIVVIGVILIVGWAMAKYLFHINILIPPQSLDFALLVLIVFSLVVFLIWNEKGE